MQNYNDVTLAGATHENRDQWIRKMTLDSELELRREPENAYDRNAVAVYAPIDGAKQKVGYVPRDIAQKIGPRMDKGASFQAVVKGFEQTNNRWYRFDMDIAETKAKKPAKIAKAAEPEKKKARVIRA